MRVSNSELSEKTAIFMSLEKIHPFQEVAVPVIIWGVGVVVAVYLVKFTSQYHSCSIHTQAEYTLCTINMHSTAAQIFSRTSLNTNIPHTLIHQPTANGQEFRCLASHYLFIKNLT